MVTQVKSGSNGNGGNGLTVLITGGAGYVGSVLCPMLLERGHRVILLDSFTFGVRPILHFIAHPRLTVIEGDVRDEDLVRKLVAQSDAVVHLAAIVGYPACAARPQDAETINVGGTLNLCKAISKQQPLVFASTGSTYGQVEGVADEETPINPLTLYGRTKRDAERMVIDHGGIGMRFATLFGVSPRLRLDLLVNDFCYQAHSMRYIVIFEGGHRRTFLHVYDAAAVYLLALDKFEQMRGQVYNVGTRTMNYTKIDVAKAIRKHREFYLHEAAVGTDLDQRNYEVSYSKIEQLGYEATISLDQGIEELLKVVPHVHTVTEFRNV